MFGHRRVNYDGAFAKRKKESSATFNRAPCTVTIGSNTVLRSHESPQFSDERKLRSNRCKQRRSLERPAMTNRPLSVGRLTSDLSSTLTTVSTVRGLIARSKEEKIKRGEYHRYTPEMRDTIAQHALRLGTHDAVQVFTRTLGELLIFSVGHVNRFLRAAHCGYFVVVGCVASLQVSKLVKAACAILSSLTMRLVRV